MTKPVDWWRIFHKAMTELLWTPEQLGKLTIPQLACLGHERAPGEARLKTEADWQALEAARKAEADEWAS